MSSQQARQRASPKQVPLRATMPLENATKEGSGLIRNSSPQGSPKCGLGNNKDTTNESKSCNTDNSTTIRRTASLDSIYLRGLFPRDGPFDKEKSTQTEFSSSLDSIPRKYDDPSDIIQGKLYKLTAKQQRRRSHSRESNKEHNLSPKTAASPVSRSPASSVPKSSRSSEEGLNQEIESYILRSESDPQSDRLRQPTPEGRKAPVADLYRICYLPNPLQALQQSYCNPDDCRLASPDQDKPLAGASPQINEFSERAPPDGAERILTKAQPSSALIKPSPAGPKPPRALFTLMPSSGSAFDRLQGLATAAPSTTLSPSPLSVTATTVTTKEQEQRCGCEGDEDSPTVPDLDVE